jgi:hypothetical protein
LEAIMCRIGTVLFLFVVGAAAASAAEPPARKAGLWEVKTTTAEGRSVSIQQCVDAQTDQAMQASAGGGAGTQRDCAKRDMQKSGDTTTIDSVCTVGGKTRTAHVVVVGSFDSGYTMTVTSQSEGAAARTVSMTAKWLGPCAADQKPGDMIMPNGMKMNILDAQKGMHPPGVPGAPPRQ